MRDSNNTGMIQLSNIGDPFIYRSDFYSVPAFPCVHDIFKTQHPRGGAGRAVCATTVRRMVWRMETALNVPCSGARAAEYSRGSLERTPAADAESPGPLTRAERGFDFGRARESVACGHEHIERRSSGP